MHQPNPLLKMENTCLQFYTREQLFEFLKRSGIAHCTLDLKQLSLCSRFTEPQIDLALYSFHAEVMVDSLVY